MLFLIEMKTERNWRNEFPTRALIELSKFGILCISSFDLRFRYYCQCPFQSSAWSVLVGQAAHQYNEKSFESHYLGLTVALIKVKVE